MGYIVWLASYPKSGNTWLRVFLRNLTSPSKPANINELATHFPYDVAAAYYHRVDPRPCPEYTRSEVLAMRGRVQKMIADTDPHVTLVKTHSALVIEDGYPLITPDVTAGAVYLVRNPLDIVISFSLHRGKSIDDTIDLMNLQCAIEPGGANAVSEHFGSWSENVDSWTRNPSPNIHVERYEDLLSAPLKTFSQIARFLGMATSRRDVEKAVKASSLRVLREQEKKNGFLERPPTAAAPFFRAGEAGQGRRQLTTSQVDRLVAVHHAQMARFGYLP